jgi:hypothetical protein
MMSGSVAFGEIAIVELTNAARGIKIQLATGGRSGQEVIYFTFEQWRGEERFFISEVGKKK